MKLLYARLIGRWVTGALTLSLTALGFLGMAYSSHSEDCHLDAGQTGRTFPVRGIDLTWRCRLAKVIQNQTTMGVIGPVQTPLSLSLYTHLLDHPVITASLAQRLGIGLFQATHRGSNQFWVNDGEGTQGLLTLVHQDTARRIYHVEGYHEGRLLPLVHANAAVFMEMKPITVAEGREAVETVLITYVQLENRMLSMVVTLLRPLVGPILTRKLARGFDATTQLSAIIAQDPDRVTRELSTSTPFTSEEVESFKTALKTVTPSHALRQSAQPIR